MVQLYRADLQFILNQILLAESGGNPPTVFHPWGLRTVTGYRNHLTPGQEHWGSADQNFPRLLTPEFKTAGTVLFDLDGPGPMAVGQQTSYAQTSGYVFDTQPRLISNLIVDQTPNNPAAVDANGGAPVVFSPGLDGVFGTADDKPVFLIGNVAPDEGLSAPFNSWFTLFGQFFDHGLDLVNKGGSGTVIIPLMPDDPLYNPLTPQSNFMVLTRATNDPGPDGVLGTADDIHEHNNQTTPFIDQNQTYTSHPSHQVFLREYVLNGAGRAVSTGEFLDGAGGGLATWGDVKAQAASMLGVLLSDFDVHNVPLLLTDEYGRFIPGANGFAQIGVRVGNGDDGRAGTADDIVVFVQGVAGGLDINSPAAITAALVAAGQPPGTTGVVIKIDHAFLDDIAHAANPGTFDPDGPTGPLQPINETRGDGSPGTYNGALLDAHYITGDGRGNENIGLTAVHTIFHAEHNRLVGAIKAEVTASGDTAWIAQWLLPGANQADGIQELEWNGERLFQAARVMTEMQYQHLVFEEFARKVQPAVDVFINIDMTINPAIFAEFAHVVYRFGHSMLTETVDRYDADFNVVGDGNPTEAGNQQIGLIAAFLNPLEFAASGVNDADAAAAIIRGMTRQSGNAIDEFVTEALRNNLVGLPLDLATLNIARARDTGIPSLNEARKQFYAMTGDAQLKPYTSWIDFAQNVKHPASVINFIAAYGTHALINAETTAAGKRAAAMAIVTGEDQIVDTGTGPRTISAPTDALDFLNALGTYATTALGGLNNVDFWIGGLAELAPAFGGMLGSTFAFVFETQMEALQNGDRFYYLARFSGQNFLAELEGNSFASLIMRNTDLKHLPGDVFATPDWTLEIDPTQQHTGLGADGRADPTYADEDLAANPFTPMVQRNNPATVGPDTNYLKYNGVGHVVLGGTDGVDILIAGIGDDTIWGDGGNDRIEGGNGFDILNGGDGDDIITDLAFDDNIKGGDGNDVIHAGNGFDLVIGGKGNDWINLGEDEGEAFAGLGNDFVMHEGVLAGLIGGYGDDWIEGGPGIGGLTGDNADVDGAALNFAGEDALGGHDVLIGSGAPNDFDSFGGDDIMVTGGGTDRLEGFIGFDWVSYQNNTQFGALADMEIRVFDPPPLPGDPGAILDRFDMVEGLSGSQFGDVLRGDDRNAQVDAEAELTLTGHELTAAGIARITGLAQLLGPSVIATALNQGNIILGGAGSDVIEGRGGNDIIDGDAWLHVAIGVDRNNDGDFNDANERAAKMKDLEPEMLSGAINPSQLGIVREILVSATTDTDTAVYTGNRADYVLEGENSVQGVRDIDGDGFIRVEHLARDAAGVVVPGLNGVDGVDLVKNIEQLQFADQLLVVGQTVNLGPVGEPVISDNTPTENQTLTVNLLGVTDPNNTATNGVVTGPVSITWEEQDEDGVWVTIMVPGPLGTEGPVPAVGPSFTPGPLQAGHALRVRYQYSDQNGVLETVYSSPTQPVIAINDAPVGALLISDTTPTEGDFLNAQIAFTDADGTHAAVFAFQWQSANNVNGPWTNIAGATTAQFVPQQAQVGLFLRAVVTYTDDAGFNETVISAATARLGDLITGTAAGNNFTGTAQDDRILGFGGADTLNGAGGDDIIDGEAGADTINGGAGNDYLLGGAAIDNISGGADNDIIDGGAGADILLGDGGNDTFVYRIGDGADNVNGGAGTGDLFDLTGTASNESLAVSWNGTQITNIAGVTLTNIELVRANMGAGTDTLAYTAASSAVTVNLLTGTATGFASIANIENVTGTNNNDTITGDIAANTLNGGDGNDTLNGGDGNDTLVGGAGLDTLNGGNGNDILDGGAANDTLNGGDGTDQLTGGAGNDVINGGRGNDTMDGNAGSDTFVFTPGDGRDTITNFQHQAGGDLIDIRAYGITNFASQVAITSIAGGVQVAIGADVIQLLGGGVTTGNVTVADFILT